MLMAHITTCAGDVNRQAEKTKIICTRVHKTGMRVVCTGMQECSGGGFNDGRFERNT